MGLNDRRRRFWARLAEYSHIVDIIIRDLASLNFLHSRLLLQKNIIYHSADSPRASEHRPWEKVCFRRSRDPKHHLELTIAPLTQSLAGCSQHAEVGPLIVQSLACL